MKTMDNTQKPGGWHSWPIIIIVLCLFWPVGLFLLTKRLSIDKKATLFMGKLLGVFSVICYCIAVIGLVVCINEGFSSEDVSVMLVFAVLGVVLHAVSKKVKAYEENAKQYLVIIVNGNVRQLDMIAKTTAKSYDRVRKEIDELIKKGYLKDMYIDENLRAVIVSDGKPIAPNAAGTAQVQAKVIHCPNCGANSTIYSDVGECEYCGSPLQCVGK